MAGDPETFRDDQYVTSDLLCVRCGYNLRTLAWDSVCPECHVAVNQSVLPAGFRFNARREAYHLRRGLLFLVISVLVAAIADVGLTVAMRYVMQLPSDAWRMAALDGHGYAYRTANVLTFLAIWFVAWPYRHSADLLGRRLRVATIVVATIGLLTQIAFWTLLSRSGPGALDDPPLPILVVARIIGLCTPVSLILLWFCLLARVDPSAMPMLRISVCVSLGFCILASLEWIMHTICSIGLTSSLSEGGNVASPGPRAFWLQWCFLSMWWHKYIGAACWAAMLLVTWMFVRRLDSALRRDVG